MNYGDNDTTFVAAGGEAGIQLLVDEFYNIMGSDPRFATIYSWHPVPDDQSRDKLARFLCGWMGGPRRYSEKYGPISIPTVHAHLKVGAVERDQWLLCMNEALLKQPYPAELKRYLIEQLSVPAERIRQACQRNSIG